jgi:uncharacterized protein
MSTLQVPKQHKQHKQHKQQRPQSQPPVEKSAPDGRVRLPWTRVLALGLGAFALWFLLFAPTLQHDAQVSPVGTRRTVSLDVTGPVAAISRWFQLSHIVSITGRSNRLPGGTVGLTTEGPAPGTAHTVSGSGSRSGHESAPGHASGSSPRTPRSVLPNPKTPTAAHPLRVLIVGDSIGIDMGGPLQSDLAQTGVVNAALDARESTGLTRPDYFNWPAELTTDLKAVQPQVVVIMMGANDAQDFLGPPDVPYSSPQWNVLYAQRAAQFMQIAESGGASVVWVGMPPMQDPTLNGQMADIDAVDQHEAALAHPPVHFLSTQMLLGNAQGGYTAFITNASGQVVNVRTPDGIHLTPDGGQVVAQSVIDELGTLGYHLP